MEVIIQLLEHLITIGNLHNNDIETLYSRTNSNLQQNISSTSTSVDIYTYTESGSLDFFAISSYLYFVHIQSSTLKTGGVKTLTTSSSYVNYTKLNTTAYSIETVSARYYGQDTDNNTVCQIHIEVSSGSTASFRIQWINYNTLYATTTAPTVT